MKYVRFEANNETLYGVLEGETITKLNENFINGNATKTEETYALSDVKLKSPIQPNQIIAIGLNYEGHAIESGKPIPEEPMMFMVSSSAVVGEGEEIVLPTLDHRIDYEAELAIVIGKEASNLTRDNALDHVFGYTINNDVSDRDLQKKDGQFTRAKSFGTFKPVGPVIETDIDPNNVRITLSIDGEVRQDSNTNDLIHDIESLLVKVTEVMTLQPGDLIITGTPSGVGPLKPGNKVEIEIEGIGKLTNYVAK